MKENAVHSSPHSALTLHIISILCTRKRQTNAHMQTNAVRTRQQCKRTMDWTNERTNGGAIILSTIKSLESLDRSNSNRLRLFSVDCRGTEIEKKNSSVKFRRFRMDWISVILCGQNLKQSSHSSANSQMAQSERRALPELMATVKFMEKSKVKYAPNVCVRLCPTVEWGHIWRLSNNKNFIGSPWPAPFASTTTYVHFYDYDYAVLPQINL